MSREEGAPEKSLLPQRQFPGILAVLSAAWGPLPTGRPRQLLPITGSQL